MTSHVLSLLVEDKPGLLTRVAGLFARPGWSGAERTNGSSSWITNIPWSQKHGGGRREGP